MDDNLTCQKRGCKNDAAFLLHLDGSGDQVDADGALVTEGREWYCAEHAQAEVEAQADRSTLIVSGL